MPRKPSVVTATVYHIHSRSDGQFIPRPLLWGTNLDRVRDFLIREMRIPSDSIAWNRRNTDSPVYTTAEGTALYLFSSELTRG